MTTASKGLSPEVGRCLARSIWIDGSIWSIHLPRGRPGRRLGIGRTTETKFVHLNFIETKIPRTCPTARLQRLLARGSESRPKKRTHQFFVVGVGRPNALPAAVCWRRVSATAAMWTHASIFGIQPRTNLTAIRCNCNNFFIFGTIYFLKMSNLLSFTFFRANSQATDPLFTY